MKVTNYVCNACGLEVDSEYKVTVGRQWQFYHHQEIDLCESCASNFVFFCLDNKYRTLKHPATEERIQP